MARMKGVYAEVAAITKRGMGGELPWGVGFAERLSIVRPTKDDMVLLADMYRMSLAPNARESVRLAQTVGVQVHIFSGGIAQAIIPAASDIGIPRTHVHANMLRFDSKGNYEGYDEKTPLANGRKDLLIKSLMEDGSIAGPVAGFGDGLMDINAVAGLRIGMGGYTTRQTVLDGADVFLRQTSLAALLPLMVGKAGIVRIMQDYPEAWPTLVTGMKELRDAVFNFRAHHIQDEINALRIPDLEMREAAV